MRILNYLLVYFIALVVICLLPLNANAEVDISNLKWERGPLNANLGENLATINISDEYMFLGAEDTKKLMTYVKEPTDESIKGLIVSAQEGDEWMIVFHYNPIGYVQDNDASKLDPEEMLKAITKATEEANKKRKELGGEPIHVINWIEEPHYDKETNNLTWSLLAEDDYGKKIINLSRRLLGRSGHMSVNCVTSPENLENSKSILGDITSRFSFNPGHRYLDYIPGKDKIASVGLAALIIGGTTVAAKSGLLTKIGLFLLLIFKKLWFILFGLLYMLCQVVFNFLKNLFKFTKPQDDSSASEKQLITTKQILDQEHKDNLIE